MGVDFSFYNKKTARFPEPFLCKFTAEQIQFIENEANIYGSKAVVVRRGIELLMILKKKELDKI